MRARIDIPSLLGQKFGQLTITRYKGRDNKSHILVSAQCDCGTVVSMDFNRIKTGNTRSCGCKQKSGLILGRNKTDVSLIIGQRFGRLTVIADAGLNKRSVTIVLTKCDCGTEKVLLLQTLKSGLTVSCGCFLRDKSKENATTHGLSKTPLYRIWKGMKSRCCNQKKENFKHYGGRGIKVCEAWINDFHAFYRFATDNGWEVGLEIDRKNNDLGYSPDNCRFVTHKINCNNRRTSKIKKPNVVK